MVSCADRPIRWRQQVKRVKCPGHDDLRGQRFGIVLMLLSCALLSAHDAATKWLTTDYPVSQVIFLRGAVAVLGIVLVEVLRSNAGALVPRDLKGQVARAGLFAASTVLLTISLKLLSLPVVTAILFASPIMVALLAGPLLKEMVTFRVWLAALLGFAGVALIVSPGDAPWTWVFLFPLASAAASALRDIVTRQLALRESTSSIVLITALTAALVGLVGMPASEWRWPDAGGALLFVLVGITQLTAHYLQVEAFRLTPASRLAPLKYSMVVWALLLGIAIWGDIPAPMMLVGAILVVVAGWFVYRRN